MRHRIENYRLRHLHTAAKVVWIAVKSAIAAVVLMFVEFLILDQISPDLFVLVFFVVDALIAIGAVREFRKSMGRGPVKGSILLGRSFGHYAKAEERESPMIVGIDGKHYIDYLGQPNHHVLINGSTQSGKTQTLLAFLGRASINGLKFLMVDWHGENEEWAKSAGATIWKVPENFKINLFKLNGLSKESRASMAAESLIVAARLTALQSTRVKSALLGFYMEDNEPTVLDLWQALYSKDAGKTNVLNQRLRTIQRVIGYEPEEFWDSIFRRNNLISLAGLNESEKSLVVYAIMQRLTELFDRKPEMRKEPRLMVVLDEAWQFFKREREFDANRESSLEKVVRLGKKYGFGLVVSTQQIDDVPKVFINSCSLLMLHQQRELLYYGKEILNLGRYGAAYLDSAAQGEMLLFDRGMAQKGQWWPDYVKAEPLSEKERACISSRYPAFVPARIYEPEMPIEVNDNGTGQQYNHSARKNLLKGLDIPSVAVYRFMVALERTESLTSAYKMLKEKSWITSDATIYGGYGKLSILARAINGGYVSREGKLTEKGLGVIDPDRLIARQGVLAGSEEHKALMRKVITKIQDAGNYTFTTSDKDGFDVGEIGAKTRSTWNLPNLTIYECQTNAIREELEKAVIKANVLNAVLIFKTINSEMARLITEHTKLRAEVD